jgi:predicted nucleic acid-binding protein
MKIRLFVLLFVALTAAPAIAGQTLSSEDSLKASHETLMQAVTSANVERVAAMVHPSALGFFRTSQHVSELSGSAALAALVQALLKDLGEFVSSQQSLTTRLRVVGDTGVVTQTLTRESVVDKRKVVRHLRNSGLYVRTSDGWKLLSWHTSDIPLAK